MARKRRPDEIVNLRLRLPEGLRATLEGEAEKAKRSLNSEILWRLGQTISEDWQRFIAGLEQREQSVRELSERVRQGPEFKRIMDELIAKQLKKEGGDQ